MKERVLIIIPAFNEEQCILDVYNKIIDYDKKNKTNYDVIVINDGSIDNTERILKDNNIPHIQLIQNLGIGGAVQTGYKYAFLNGYDIAIQYDGDGQHEIACVKDLIKPIVNNECDMVIGSRFVKIDNDNFKSTFARRIGINIISLFIKIFARFKIADPTSGFRACNKKLIEFFSNTYPTEYPEPVSEVAILEEGFKVKEVSAKMHERQGGKSSIHAWKNVYYMINVTIAMFIESIKR